MYNNPAYRAQIKKLESIISKLDYDELDNIDYIEISNLFFSDLREKSEYTDLIFKPIKAPYLHLNIVYKEKIEDDNE